jgi:hypothetical protein
MRRRGRRLAQATLRGMLLFGGVIAAWGAFDAALEGPAYAAEEPRQGIIANLLDDAGAVLDGVLSPPPASPGGSATVGRDSAGTDAVCEPAPATAGTAGTRAPVREPDPAVRVPSSELARVVAPVGRVVDQAAGAGVAEAVKAVAPVTRPVVDAAAPVVREIAGTGLLEPVEAVVRPVTEPVLEILGPVLAPVSEVTRPILGQPADPAVPPGEPVEPQPGPVGAVPVTTAPGTNGRTAPMPAVHPMWPQAAPSGPDRTVPVERWDGGGSAAGAEVSRGPGRGGTGTGGLTPISSGSATASAAAGAAAASVAEISPHPWTPQLVSQRCHSSRCDMFAGRSPQPGTRPA